MLDFVDKIGLMPRNQIKVAGFFLSQSGQGKKAIEVGVQCAPFDFAKPCRIFIGRIILAPVKEGIKLRQRQAGQGFPLAMPAKDLSPFFHLQLGDALWQFQTDHVDVMP